MYLIFYMSGRNTLMTIYPDEIKIYGCVINKVDTTGFITNKEHKYFYAVRHLKTNKVIDVLNYHHALLVAKLLNLEYLIVYWVYHGEQSG